MMSAYILSKSALVNTLADKLTNYETSGTW